MNIYLLDHGNILRFSEELTSTIMYLTYFKQCQYSVFGWGLIGSCVIFLTPHSKFMDITLQ
jgi:hypothetical protein